MKNLMKNSTLLLMEIGLTLASLSTLAASAPDFDVTPTLIANTKLKILFTAPPKHHFNLDAPLALTIDKTKVVTPKKTNAATIEFQVPIPVQKPSTILAVAYLCDYAKTYCEKHAVNVAWDGTTLNSNSSAKKSTSNSNPKTEAPPVTTPQNGFIFNRPNEALELSKSTKKPLLIDFYGIWCPPCNMLDERVFSSPEFKKIAKDFVLLKLDADHSVSWELKTKYRVGGYPTVLILNSNQEEISRIVGFRAPNEFITVLNKALSSPNESFENLELAANAGSQEALEKIGLIYFERAQFKEAANALKGSKMYREKFVAANIQSLLRDEATSKKKLIVELQNAINEFPKSITNLEYFTHLAEFYSEQNNKESARAQWIAKAKLAQELTTSADALLGTDHTPADLWIAAAESYENLGVPEKKQEMWKNAANYYLLQIQTAKLDQKHERGYNLERAYSLWNSGDQDGARKIYISLQNRFPKEFTFHYGHASVALKSNLVAEAKPHAESALRYSYGDNKLRATALMAKVLIAEGNKNAAKQLLKNTIAATRAPNDPIVRTHRYLKTLKELLISVEK